MDDPDLVEKMKAEAEGIFLWAFAGLLRLAANRFKFTESDRIKANRESVKWDNNNIFDFMESDGYIRYTPEGKVTANELYQIYEMWRCENALPAFRPRSFSDAESYQIWLNTYQYDS